LFREERPILFYTPHWQAHRSSWPSWGQTIVDLLAAQERYNVILAPHQRLVETASEVRAVFARVAGLPHVHCDLDSFAMVDGSYTAAADIYLGDTSSQVVEYMTRPRPCIFLNPQQRAWEGDPSYAQWHCGQVVNDFERLAPAIAMAASMQPDYEPRQVAFAHAALGDASGSAPHRAARSILDLLSKAVP
jgi:CDP-glycerol glycerophosphotransferase (TagB/SpsB family)